MQRELEVQLLFFYVTSKSCLGLIFFSVSYQPFWYDTQPEALSLPRRGGYVFGVVRLFVFLPLSRIVQSYWPDVHETWCQAVAGPKEEPFKFSQRIRVPGRLRGRCTS